MTDPRTAAVEQNLLAFLGGVADLPQFRRLPDPDVVAYHSDIAFPLFNAVVDARFAPGAEAERTRAVLAPYLERGLPFLWWATPSTSSPAMAEVLAAAGLQREDVPGMHVPLDGPPPAAAGGIDLAVVDAVDPGALIATMVAGFGFPDDLVGPMTRLFADYPADDMVNVVASVDGEPAGCGTAYVLGDTVGLYNIATVERFRGRGVGYAVTAALLDHGRERGCTQAVLHATEMGRPVYERLGFVEVCRVPQYVWAP